MKRITLFLFGLALLAGVIFIAFNSTQAQALDENGCLTCHGDPGLTKTGDDGSNISLYVSEKDISMAAHRYIDCTTCHAGDPHEADAPMTKLSLAEKCGTCHQYEQKLHLESIHGKQLVQGNQDVATCVDCHSSEGSPHSIIRVLEYNAPTYKKNIAQTCANCHDNEELMADYGKVEKVYESYMRSFHGKAIQLGTYEMTQLDKATCTNCHGVHNIQSVDDASSPVAGLDNLTKTCEQCHPDAGAKFAASFLGHKDASPQHVPVVYYIERFFTVLLTTVLSFGALMVVMAVVRYSRNRWRE